MHSRIGVHLSKLSGEDWKTLTVGPCSSILENSRISIFVILAPRLYNSYNHSHHRVPCARPAHVAESWPRARLLASGSRMFMLRVKTLSARAWDRYWQNPLASKKIIEREQQYKSAHVSALTCSVPRKMAEGRQRVSLLFSIMILQVHTSIWHLENSSPLLWNPRYSWKR